MTAAAVRIRVALLTDEMEAGGSQRQIVNIAKNLDRSRFDVSVVYFTNASHMLRELEEAKVRTIHIPKRSRFDAAFLRALIGLFRQEHFDVIHCFSFSGEFWGAAGIALTPAALRPALVSSVRGRYEWYRSLHWRIKHWVTKRSFATVSNSKAGAQYACERMRLPADTCQIIPNGVELPTPDVSRASQLRKEFQSAGASFVVLFVGRLVDHKDVPTLLAAACKCRDKGLPIRFVLAGDGPLRDELERLTADSALGTEVLFLGERSDVADLLAASDALALTSVREGLSNVILEAMSKGLPVLATRAGGNVELIRDMNTGMLFDIGDADALVACIERLFRTPELRKSLGDAARAHAADNYSVSAMARRFSELYRAAAHSRLAPH